jgi:hypothetical protein
MKLARIAEGYIAYEHPRVSAIEAPRQGTQKRARVRKPRPPVKAKNAPRTPEKLPHGAATQHV